MIGSDLESKNSAGTADFNEMVTGLRSLTEQQRQQLDLRIAFGGANKDGWRGVKWMDAEQLLRDSADGVYGNETEPDSYQYVDQSANMGEPATLTRFLDMTNQTSAAPESRFVVLWDHGGAYGGYGPDEVFNTSMTLDDLNAAFANSTLPKLDMVGFDACLMASLEVGKTMRPYSDRLIASEELEPGHGWDYRYVVPAFVTSNSVDGYATGLVDNFVDSANHPYESMGKCLSVVDLNAYDGLQTALTAYGDSYGSELLPIGATTTGFVRATTQAQAYGVERDDQRVSLDLVDFVNQSVFFGGRSTAQSAGLLAAIDSYVIYSNDDGSLSGGGVSIIPPDLTGQSLPESNYAGTGWFDLVQASIALIGSDVTPPVLSNLTITADGVVAGFVDPLLTRVSAVYGLEVAGGEIQVLGTEAATRIGNTDEWSIDGWDGETVHLNSAGAATPVPLTFGNMLTFEGEELALVYSYIQLIEADDPDQATHPARINLYLDSEGTVVDTSVVAQTVDSEGNITIEKVEKGLSTGDRIRFLSDQLPVGPQTAAAQTRTEGPELVLQNPTFTTQLVSPPAGTSLVYAIVGQDFARNRTVSDLQPLTPVNN